MKFVSLFSGIEAASVAFAPIGWECMAVAEIDEFPCAVLAHRFPDVPNLGDVSDIDWGKFVEEHGRPDVLIGGPPCVSFSIAGRRDSLDGPSRIMFEYCRAFRELQPEWVIFENVPGILNVRDNAFGQLLRELQEAGYVSLAWRVLDAEWFGVAQRRRRVLLVGHLGGGGGAAAVLVESESLQGDTQTRVAKRKELASAPHGGSGEGGTICMTSGQANSEVDHDLCGTISGRSYKDPPIVAKDVVVIDRAAYNQGVNAAYKMHIEEADVMDTLVARGPHAVGYRRTNGDS